MNGDPAGDRAPGRLGVIQDLANSYDLRRGRDEIATSGDASRWMEAMGLIEAAIPLSDDDLLALHQLRAALRGLLLANNVVPARAEDIEVLNRAIRDSGLGPRFVDGASFELQVPSGGFVGGLGRVAAIVCEAMQSGTWKRMKACPEDACNYAFYDRSANASRTWCAMARCGSRVKMRSYRARLRGRSS